MDPLRRFTKKYMTINAGKSRNVIRDFGIYSAVMAVCTLVGLLFRRLGFSDATIITVYILGVLISAVLVSRYISNIFVSFMAMIVFNFFFTEPLFTLHAYDAECLMPPTRARSFCLIPPVSSIRPADTMRFCPPPAVSWPNS